jgi:DNA-binding response OmpR family regulator
VRSTALVVNVHKSEQKLLQHFLIQAGYQVLLSDTSDEALELCRDYKGKIHLLVTDAEAPGTSGWELSADSQGATKNPVTANELAKSEQSPSLCDRAFGEVCRIRSLIRSRS